jgi:hypothetical protein
MGGESTIVSQDSTDIVIPPHAQELALPIGGEDPVLNFPGFDNRLEGSQNGSEFGKAVSSAGDVNGDSYADVVAGAWMYDNGEADEGAVFLYYGSASGVQTPHAFMADGDRVNAYFGFSAAAAGDVDADGYDDFLVGAPYYSLTAGSNEGEVIVYAGSASGVQEVDATILQGASGDGLGYAVAGGADFNGDGYADVAAGSMGPFSEFVRVYYGSPTGIPTTPSWVVNGPGSSYFGRAVDSAGDVNNDGYDDLIVGTYSDWVYVYYGSATGLDKNGTRPTGSTANADWSASGVANQRFGQEVSGAGDVNGDGYDDVLIAQPAFGGPAAAAYLYYGSPTGLNANGTRPQGNVSNADWSLTCQDGRTGVGYKLGSAGDLNADGFGDIFVRVLGRTETRLANHEYIFLGSANGLHQLQDVRLTDSVISEGFGEAVRSAGDVNGDGFGDLIVGATLWNSTGAAYLFHGFTYQQADWALEGTILGGWMGADSWTAGDVNHDSYSDLIAGAPGQDFESNIGYAQVYHGSAANPARTPAITLSANRAGDTFGRAVSAAGDVNGDSYADVVIGAPYRSNGQTNEGAAYVYYGSPTGIIEASAWISESNIIYSQMGYSVASANVNGDAYSDVIIGQPGYPGTSPNFTGRVLVYYGSSGGIANPPSWTATQQDYYFSLGMHVASAGDVNGDGYEDVMAQAYSYDEGSGRVGAVYVWYGSSGGLGHAGPCRYGADWMAVGSQVNGMFGLAGGSAGDVNGDGYDDLLVGAPGYDVTAPGTISNAGAAFLWYGSASGLGDAGTVANADWAFYGDKAEGMMGWSAGTAGDFNADGYDDLVIGAGQYSDAYTNEGKAWVFYGSPSGPGSTPNWTQKGFQKYALFGASVGPAGDVDHDGYADLLIGASRHGIDESNGYPTNRGRVYVYYGRQSLEGLSVAHDGPTEVGHIATLTATLLEGTRVTYQWDFGDGSPIYTSPLDVAGTGSTATHSYPAAGIYTIRVRASSGVEQLEAETALQVFEDLNLPPGGSFTTSDQILTFDAPPGLAETVTITYTPQITAGHSLGDFDLAGIAFHLVAVDQNGNPLVDISPPITVTVSYDPALLPLGAPEEDLELRRYDSGLGSWVPLTVVARDTAANTLTARLDHFSDFALLAPETQKVYLPEVIR